MNQRFFVWLAALLLAACNAADIAYTPVPTPNATQRAERYSGQPPERAEVVNPFGVVEGFWFPELTCELGVGWERLIFNWEQHQPTGPEDWHTLNVDDRWLVAADACNREVVALLKHTPAWATDGIPVAGLPRGLDLPIDDPNNLWANFVRQTVRYYRGRMGRGVTHFIIWNEPDIEPGTYGFEFDGQVEDYYRLLKVAYLAAKEANPDAIIHLAGTTYWHDVNAGRRLYVDRLIERIHQDPEAAQHHYYFDVLSLHIYFRTDSIYDIVQAMRAVLAQYGLADKRIWINETNAPPSADPAWPVDKPQFRVTLEQQAQFLVQAAALAQVAGVERMAVYKLYDQQLTPGYDAFGLLSPVDASPRPAFYAWQMVIDRFGAIRTAQLARTDTVDVVRFEYADGRQMWLAWARRAAPTRIELTAVGAAERLDIYGGTTPLSPENNAYTLTLPGATCDEREGCFIGGPLVMVMQPPGAVTVYELVNTSRIALQFE